MVYLRLFFTILFFTSSGNAITFSGYVALEYFDYTLAEQTRPPTVFIFSETGVWEQILATDSPAYKNLLDMHGYWVEVDLGLSPHLPFVRKILKSNRNRLDYIIDFFVGEWTSEKSTLRIERNLLGKISWIMDDKPAKILSLSNLVQLPPYSGYIGDLPVSFDEATRAFVREYTNDGATFFELILLTSKNGHYDAMIKLKMDTQTPLTLQTKSEQLPILPPFSQGMTILIESSDHYARSSKFHSPEICNQLFPF